MGAEEHCPVQVWHKFRQHARWEGTPGGAKGDDKGGQEHIRVGSRRAPEWAPPRLSHIFPGVLCASLPHFSGEPAIEKPARGLRQIRSRHRTAHLAIPLSQRRLAHKRAPLGHRPVRRAAGIAQADNGARGYCPVPLGPPFVNMRQCEKIDTRIAQMSVWAKHLVT